MYHSIYREQFRGIGIGRVERDENFTGALGYYHNEYQIQYICGGERYFFNDGVCYRMETGSIAFIDKRRIVKTCVIGGHYHDRILIELEEQYFSSLFDLLGMNLQEFFEIHHGVFRAGSNPKVQSFLSLLDHLMRGPKQPSREQRLKLALLQLAVDAPDWDTARIPRYMDEEMRFSIEKQRRVHQVVDYINSHYTTIHSADDVAGHFYMNKSYLCRIFKEVTNFTISEYINLHRIAASQEYLLNSDLPITQIAALMGYESLTYYERVFKRQLSVTPLQYRRIHSARS